MSHIALVFPDLEAGGAQRVGLMLAEQFLAAGHQVELVLLQSTGRFQSMVPEGLNVISLSSAPSNIGRASYAFLTVIRLVSWLKRRKPQYILSTVTGANLTTLLARRLSGVSSKLIIREAVTLQNVRSRARLWAMQRMYAWADNTIAVSSAVQEQLISHIGLDPKKVHHIQNPVDVPAILRESKLPLDHSCLLRGQRHLIVSVGRLTPQKDYQTLLHAIAELPRDLDARLALVGDGPERKDLESLAISLRIKDRVDFIGFDSNPWRWMARARLFVLSSRWEGSPNVLLEALALGVPTIATSFDESIAPIAKNCGFGLVPVGDPHSMAEAITRELTCPTPNRSRLCAPDPAQTAARYLSFFY